VLVAALMIGGASFWVVSQAATAQAINTAELVTQLDARNVVRPLLTRAALDGRPAAVAQLDAVVRARVLSSRVLRVKIWTASCSARSTSLRPNVGASPVTCTTAACKTSLP
jgi:hypothetical protein